MKVTLQLAWRHAQELFPRTMKQWGAHLVVIVLPILPILSVWQAVDHSANVDYVSFAQYFLLFLAIQSIFFLRIDRDLTHLLRGGAMPNLLAQPWSWIGYLFIRQLISQALPAFVVLIALVVFFFFQGHAMTAPLFIVTFVFGLVGYGMIQLIIGLTVFWWPEPSAIRNILRILMIIAIGGVIPFSLLSDINFIHTPLALPLALPYATLIGQNVSIILPISFLAAWGMVAFYFSKLALQRAAKR